MTVVIRPGACAHDVQRFVSRMHSDDVREAIALGVKDHTAELLDHFRRSDEGYFLELDGQLLMAFGVIEDSCTEYIRRGGVWLLTTIESREHPVVVARTALRVLRKWQRSYHVLQVYVHDRHEHGRKLAEFTGFSASGSIRAGTGETFVTYERSA